MKPFLFLGLLCLVSPVFAQPAGSVKVEMSPVYKNEQKQTYVTDMFNDPAGNIYLVKSEDKMTAGEVLFGAIADKDPVVLIEKYDKSLKRLFSKTLSAGEVDGYKRYYQGVYRVRGKPWFFSAYFDKKEDMRYLYRHELGDDGRLGGGIKVAQMESKKGGGRFNILYSPDSALLAVVTRPAVKGKKPEEMRFQVFDGDFNAVQEGATTFPYINKEMDIKGFTVTNQGDFSALVSWEDDKNTKKFVEELFVFPAGEKEPRRIPIDLGENFLLHFQVNADQNGNLYGVGMYNLISKKEKFKRGVPPTSLGTAWVRIDRATWKAGKPVLNPYKTETKTFMESKSKLVYGYGFQYFDIFKTWLDDDGRVYLDMEQDWYIETQGQIIHSVNNYSEMIVLIGFDPAGKVEREVIVPHKVTGGGTVLGLFHLALRKDDTFYFIYNDNAKNFREQFKTVKDIEPVIAPGSSGIALKSKKPNVVICSVGPKGDKHFDAVFNFEDMEVFLHTPDFLLTGANTVVVVGIHDREFRLFRLEF
ncbi:MAG: hypothetical protein H6565_11710 [Lewinellaceae bacterium]|nr:hypothetical protein [Lewinellaceae bacterium]